MKFLLAFLFSSIFVLSFLSSLIISVDPYDKLGNNPWGFETKAVAQSRENKFILLENSNVDYKVFLLGSSAAHRFPMTRLSKSLKKSAFNYSTQHTTPEDYLAILRHIIAKKDIEMLFLQIGFAELNENYETDNRLYNSSLFQYLREKKKDKTIFDNNYFTLNAIRDSFRVIFVNQFGKALHNKYVEHGDYISEKPLVGTVSIQQENYGEWKLSQKRVAILRKIKEICLKKKIKLIVFTAPLSLEHYKVAISHSSYPTYKKALLEIFDSFWNFHHDSIANYNDRKYFINSTHMSREFSSLLMDRMLGKSDLELGEFLSSSD